MHHSVLGVMLVGSKVMGGVLNRERGADAPCFASVNTPAFATSPQ